MPQHLTKYKKYLADFQLLQSSPATESEAWIREIREQALARFSELGFPTARRGNEEWKYTNVGPIANTEFSLPVDAQPGQVTLAEIQRVAPWHNSWRTLVFLDGHYSQALSSTPSGTNGVTVMSLADAIATDQNRVLVEQYLTRSASFQNDGFVALNTAFVQDGALVNISDGERMESPLHLLFVSTDREQPTVSYPRVLVVAGQKIKATIIESYVGLAQNNYFTNGVSEMVVGKGAEVKHYRLLAESGSAFNVGVARVRLDEDSTFTSSSFFKDARLGRYDLYVLMDGPGATCTLDGLYLTTGTQHMDSFINIDHAKPHGVSRLLYKGILDGRSRAVFGGTVWVREGAIKTDSLQTDKNLLLSPDAEVDSKPALFIYADDVKCGHGATAGNVDEDTIFYMRSRGVDLETASRLLLYGFASEIIDTVKVDELRVYLEKLFLESIPHYKFEF